MVENKKKLSLEMREKILRLAARTNSARPHLGSCLSCIDIITEVQLFQMKKIDKFILSKGHASLALYTVLNKKGRLSEKLLDTYFQEGSYFGIHTSSCFPQEIPLPTGSLGHGLSFACGLTKGYIIQKVKPIPRIFCLMSDGECNEGSVWEAALFASRHNLNNLVVIIDKNGFQGIDRTSAVLGDAATSEKWKSFGFNTVECDGHNYQSLEKAFKKLYGFSNRKPGVLIANTVRGKGLKRIEGRMISNYFSVKEVELDTLLTELK